MAPIRSPRKRYRNPASVVAITTVAVTGAVLAVADSDAIDLSPIGVALTTIWWTAPLLIYVAVSTTLWASFIGIAYLVGSAALLHRIYTSSDPTEGLSLGIVPVYLWAGVGILLVVEKSTVAVAHRVLRRRDRPHNASQRGSDRALRLR